MLYDITVNGVPAVGDVPSDPLSVADTHLRVRFGLAWDVKGFRWIFTMNCGDMRWRNMRAWHNMHTNGADITCDIITMTWNSSSTVIGRRFSYIITIHCENWKQKWNKFRIPNAFSVHTHLPICTQQESAHKNVNQVSVRWQFAWCQTIDCCAVHGVYIVHPRSTLRRRANSKRKIWLFGLRKAVIMPPTNPDECNINIV